MEDNQYPSSPAPVQSSPPHANSPVDGAPLPPMTPAQPDPPEIKHNRDGLKSVVSTILILLAAPLIALSLTAFVFQSYEVDGPSMSTTLENHDRLIVVKTARTWSRITGHDYIPRRNDIVIFIKHGLVDESRGQDKQLIKRVVGLPGDRVVVNNGILTVFNKDNPEGIQPDKTYSYGSVITTTPGSVDIVVPPGEIFVCGDNRVNSLDSRIFGTVPAHDIVGRLAIRLLPFSQAKRF